jgi:hypothetical protein
MTGVPMAPPATKTMDDYWLDKAAVLTIGTLRWRIAVGGLKRHNDI